MTILLLKKTLEPLYDGQMWHKKCLTVIKENEGCALFFETHCYTILKFQFNLIAIYYFIFGFSMINVYGVNICNLLN